MTKALSQRIQVLVRVDNFQDSDQKDWTYTNILTVSHNLHQHSNDVSVYLDPQLGSVE